MKKKISFEIETVEEDNSYIEAIIDRWIRDNFRMPTKVKINIEDLEG